MPSPRNNPPVIAALQQASTLSRTPEEFGLRLDSLSQRYARAGQGKDFDYCLLHWLRTARLPTAGYREEIAKRLLPTQPS